MKTKSAVKILLDITMYLLFIFLVFGFEISPLFHEVAGIGIVAMYALHLFLNRQFISAAFKGKISNTKCKINFVLDSVLLIGIITITATGILISNSLFPNSLSIDYALLSGVHSIASYVCLGVMTLHVAAHAKYMLAGIKNMFKNINKPAVVRAYASFAACFVIATVIYMQFFGVDTYKQSDQVADIIASATRETSSSESSSEPSSSKPETLDMTGSLYSASSSESSSETSSSSEASIEESSEEESSSEETVSATPEPTQTPAVTLSDFLGNMTCTACGKRCSLLSPRCGRGEQQAQVASQTYYDEYGLS